jgi:hypothetical protein
MEDALKQILNKLDTMGKDINTLKEGQAFLLKLHFEQEDKTNSRFEDLNSKLDRIYINTDGIAKNFTDTTQELSVVQYRQQEHSGQLESHEERIKKLETVE